MIETVINIRRVALRSGPWTHMALVLVAPVWEAQRSTRRAAGRLTRQLARGCRPRWDERGSGTVYALGVIAVLLAAAVGIAGLIQAAKIGRASCRERV